MFKKSVVIKARRIKPLKWDYETIILFTLFVCGVILGIFIIKNSSIEIQGLLKNCLNNYISTKNQNGYFTCFSGLLVLLLLFLFFDFLLGLCAIGTPLIWLIPVIFGIISGCLVSIFFINYGLKGIFYCVLVDLVCYAITAATLIKCCCESTKMSIELFSCVAGNNNYRNIFSLKEYMINYLILCIPVIIGALISTFCFKIFASLFIFT